MIEVVVIGGGIAGSTVALALHDRGAAVTVVDAERPGAAATGASAGMLAPQYESPGPGPLYSLALRARSRYPAFVEKVETLSGLSLHLRGDGMLVANLDDRERQEAEAAIGWQRESGARAELVDSAEARRLQPGISAGISSWLWLADESQIDSQALVEVLSAALAAAGVRVLPGTRVAAVRSSGTSVDGVTLDDGRTLDADTVILAAGAWSDEVDGLPRPVPVAPLRGQMLRFSPGPVELTRLVTSHMGRYLVPRDDGSILAGSTMEDVGHDRSVTEEGAGAIHRSVSELVPGLGSASAMEQWADLRPMAPDGHPIIGHDPEVEGLFYATGYGRNGILLGPHCAEAVADLVVGLEPSMDWRPFSIDRFER